MADQSFHPDGKFDQVDFERGRCHLRGDVAPQRIWIAPQSFPAPRRIAKTAEGTAEAGPAGRVPDSRIEGKTRAN